MTFTVSKLTGQGYSIDYGNGAYHGLAFDECLGACARAIINGDVMSSNPWDHPYVKNEAEYALTVIQVNHDRYQWMIQHSDGRFISMLTDDEALGFLAAYLLCGRECFGGLKDYLGCINQFGERWIEPTALIPVCV